MYVYVSVCVSVSVPVYVTVTVIPRATRDLVCDGILLVSFGRGQVHGLRADEFGFGLLSRRAKRLKGSQD